MNLKQMTGWGQSHSPPAGEAQNIERCLTLLAEGAALNAPEIDAPAYKAFRDTVSAMARQIPDRLPDSDLLPVVKDILHEFENYRNGAESALRDRQAGWRALAATLLGELLGALGIDPASESAAPLTKKIGSLEAGEEIQSFRGLLADFLHPGGIDGPVQKASSLKVADRSTENDNAAGLRGGGAAQEHVKRIMEQGGNGFVVLFRLSCLEVISQRFGLEAVQDCLMAVSAFLTHSLHADDAIYHWSDSSLLAVLQDRGNEQILSAELQRIVNNNREITIQIGERTVMLRIPLVFELTPIARFRSADEVNKLSRESASKW